jgi:starch synthase (maltosyl-transferring)
MPFLARLNAIRRAHPAMARLDSLRYHHVDNDEVTAYSYRRGSDTVVVIVNINPAEVREATVHLDHSALGLPWNGGYEVYDEITGQTFTWHGGGNYVRLDPADGPGHVLSVVR